MLYNNSNKNVWKLLSVSGQIKVLYLADYVEQTRGRCDDIVLDCPWYL